jgi:hypothetical protein
VVPAVLDGDGVLDDLQEIAAISKAWSTFLTTPCSDEERWLEG